MSWLPKVLRQMAVSWQAPFRKIKNEHETELYYKTKNGSTSRGQGNHPAVTVTLQFIKDLAFQKGQRPLGCGSPRPASRKAS
jgi:hypothetical protein